MEFIAEAVTNHVSHSRLPCAHQAKFEFAEMHFRLPELASQLPMPQ
jgi:hypothetical protein